MATIASPVRVQQRTAAYWRVTFDNPPINLHDAEVVAACGIWSTAWTPTPASRLSSSTAPTPTSTWPTSTWCGTRR